MASLYELNESVVRAIEWGCDEDGCVLNDEEVNKLIEDRDSKIENIGLYYKNLLSDAESYKVEKNVFAEREKAAKNKADSLKKYLSSVLCGEKFKSTKLSISYRKSEAVEITDLSKIDDDYLKYSEPTVDKAKIKASIKSGISIDGATIIENQNIQIK